MASSLSAKSFIGALSSDRSSRFGSSPHSDLRSAVLQISTSRRQSRSPTLEVKAVGSTYGNYFRVTTFGESHGGGVGCVIDGCPPRIPLSEADLQVDLDRRRPGQSRITTPRKETDTAHIYSGVAEGYTTGSPIMIKVPNTDQRGKDYSEMSMAYRPSHADATYDFKYGTRSVEGGGRSSARETIGRVAAGAVAKKILKAYSGTEVLAYVSQAHKVVLLEELVDHETLTLDQVESNIARCPDPEYAEKMIAAIDAVRVRGDSVGGVVTCIVRNLPRGLGSPVFDKLEAELAKAALSLPATKGFEFGSGFAGTFLTGSEHNDEFYMDEHGRVRTRTNRSGGIQGGISNGEIINMRIAFKPTSTISRKQNTVTRDKKETELIARGRHDPCVVPRAVPMVEASVALVLIDQLLAQYAQCQLFPINPEFQEPLQLPKLQQTGIPL
ncbi:putative chorismate synthase [Helianthus annuus]|uniref:Chorismate synthase n=1 Tax=Helianthus annuus TaxID=4232 RepID=A0A251SEG6_HELAN|nr:chorismate synthase 1, chloroplastic [Helianthus annuus]KAF5766980.1 putative chorismate synthase [Helianthus annuus]KAJ0453323.1 putative chorismate synthase [Helianthus annuus]KAJ0475234.1 putative chorismate synthase [Helianthus annuus]KAJ0650785.1 putative chorismate synthase [Helianthus annuus]KAJ0654539.1 putative chorismate synthase [Helianthus annuus]